VHRIAHVHLVSIIGCHTVSALHRIGVSLECGAHHCTEDMCAIGLRAATSCCV
jgi:hypothetical protein